MKKINHIFFIWLLSLYLVGILVYLFFEFNRNGGVFFEFAQEPSLTKYFSIFAQWDGGNYLSISKYGYIHQYFFAYFPLYPAIIGLFGFVISPIIAGITTSIFCTVFFIQFWIQYCKNIYRLDQIDNLILAIILFPSSFILVCVYPESLFLLLSVVSSYLFFVKKQYFPAVIFASLASITRVHGLIFLFLLNCNLMLKKELNRVQKVLLVSISVIPFSIWMQSQFVYTGNPFNFLSSQTHWQRFNLPKLTIQFDYIGIITLINSTLILVVFFLIAKHISKLKKFDRLYLILSIAMPILTGSLDSVPRYLLSSYPIYLILFYSMQKSKLRNLIMGGFILLQSFYLSLFLAGYWTF